MISARSEFIDHSAAVSSKAKEGADIMMGLMAAAVEAAMKTDGEVPFLPVSTKWAQRGALRTSIRHQRLAPGRYKVSAGEQDPASAYAAAQEAGTTGGHQIKNYSTPGTGPHFFQHAVDKIKERAREYAMTAMRSVGMGGF